MTRPDTCCGACPPTTTGHDCTCQDNPWCPMFSTNGGA